MGAILLLFVFTAFVTGTTLFWFIARALGLLSDTRPVFTMWPLVVIGLFVFVFMLVMAALRTWRGTALPVADLMEAAKRVETGDYTARVQERGPRDVRELARAFNAMVSGLQQNEEQRRNMLADVTHELRTPLTIIQGNLEGLLDNIYPRDDAHLAMILDETHVFARLVEDLRTLALVESGTLVLRREPTDIAALMHETVTSFAPQADTAGVNVCEQIEPAIPQMSIDPARIRAVLTNLLANALRYTPRGGSIQVNARLVPPEGPVEVSVADTGSGIAPEVLPRIFDRFYKSSDSHGSGLGLAIARHLVLAHHGDIKAESTPGQGTRITFSLPLNN
jgi:signal transduction histidine kinase